MATFTFTGSYPDSTGSITSGYYDIALAGTLSNANISAVSITWTVRSNGSSNKCDVYIVIGGTAYQIENDVSYGIGATVTTLKTYTLSSAALTALGNGNSTAIRIGFVSGQCRWSQGDAFAVEATYTIATTACGAPTTALLSATVAESNPTLSWSGATAGSSNAITGYEIEYADSSNNSSWGSWTALTTVSSTTTSGSTTVALPTTRGYYRKYRIRTQGAASSSYYSAWKETTSVRKNTVPNQASSVVVSPSLYTTGDVTLSWSGVVVGASAVKAYMLGYKTSADAGSTWSGSWTVITTISSTATSGSRTFTPSTASGLYTIGNSYKFAVWTIDALDVYSNQAESNTIQCANPTSCGAPNITISPMVVETSLTVSWSGASGGTGNVITGYIVEYSDSTDGIAWSSWVAFTTITSTSSSGSFSVAPSLSRGSYCRFRIRTMGSAGETYYSDWAVSPSAMKNTIPSPPTTFAASPASYFDTQVTLQWSGAIPGASPIKNYIIQQSTSADGTNWTGWTLLTTVALSATSGNYTVTPTNVDGMRTRFRIAVTDALDVVSAYTTSNIIQRMSTPETPIVVAPRQVSTTYNTTPRFLIKTGGTPDGRTQRVCVKIGSGAWLDSVANANRFSISGLLQNGVSTIFRGESITAGDVVITIRCSNDAGFSAEVTRHITVLSTVCEPITASVTIIKAEHTNALRTAVNNLRLYYGMPQTVWQEPIIAHRTPTRDWPLHIKEVRAALEGVVALINAHDAVTTFDVPLPVWVPLTAGPPRADVANQIIDLIQTL
jgi:hypothetical protein